MTSKPAVSAASRPASNTNHVANNLQSFNSNFSSKLWPYRVSKKPSDQIILGTPASNIFLTRAKQTPNYSLNLDIVNEPIRLYNPALTDYDSLELNANYNFVIPYFSASSSIDVGVISNQGKTRPIVKLDFMVQFYRYQLYLQNSEFKINKANSNEIPVGFEYNTGINWTYSWGKFNDTKEAIKAFKGKTEQYTYPIISYSETVASEPYSPKWRSISIPTGMNAGMSPFSYKESFTQVLY